MSLTIDRDGARTRANPGQRRRHGGPVLLATFAGVPFETQAARLAVESAADMGATLFVVDLVRPDRGGAPPAARPVEAAQAAALGAIAELAGDLGVEVESLVVPARRPVNKLLGTLLELVAERRPALVVLGSDPAGLRVFGRRSRRRYWRLLGALAEGTWCLLWTAQQPVAAGAACSSRPPASAPFGPRG